MLTINIEPKRTWDEDKEQFINLPGITLQLEHSLIAISKWESIWTKPFLSETEQKTREMIVSYIECMTITQNVPKEIYQYIDDNTIKIVNDYLTTKHTATWFREDPRQHGRHVSSETPTSELIYYWMIEQGIPMDCAKWNLERLMTLIRVCRVKNSGDKKMSQREILQQNAALNAARRKKK